MFTKYHLDLISGSMSNANAGQTMGIATSSSYSSDGLLLGWDFFQLIWAL